MFGNLRWCAEFFGDPAIWALKDFARSFDMNQRSANHGSFESTVDEYGKTDREVLAEYDALIGASFAKYGEEKMVGYVKQAAQNLGYKASAVAQEKGFCNLARLICLASPPDQGRRHCRLSSCPEL